MKRLPDDHPDRDSSATGAEGKKGTILLPHFWRKMWVVSVSCPIGMLVGLSVMAMTEPLVRQKLFGEGHAMTLLVMIGVLLALTFILQRKRLKAAFYEIAWLAGIVAATLVFTMILTERLTLPEILAVVGAFLVIRIAGRFSPKDWKLRGG